MHGPKNVKKIFEELFCLFQFHATNFDAENSVYLYARSHEIKKKKFKELVCLFQFHATNFDAENSVYLYARSHENKIKKKRIKL